MIKKTKDTLMVAVTINWMNRHWWKVMAVLAAVNGVLACTATETKLAVLGAVVGVGCIVCAVQAYGWRTND